MTTRKTDISDRQQPSPDAMTQAKELFATWMKTRPADTYQSSIMSTEATRLVAMIAAALSAARAEGERAMRERAAKKAEDMGHSNGRILSSHKHIAAAIRSLLPPSTPET